MEKIAISRENRSGLRERHLYDFRIRSTVITQQTEVEDLMPECLHYRSGRPWEILVEEEFHATAS